MQTAQELQIVPGAVLGLPLDFTEQMRPRRQRLACTTPGPGHHTNQRAKKAGGREQEKLADSDLVSDSGINSGL